MSTYSKLFVAGHQGMVGSAVLRALAARGAPPPLTATHAELDLTNQADTQDFINQHQPDAIILAAAHVGGIEANRAHIGTFLYQNLMIAANVIHSAHVAGVPRLLFLGSTCIYPKLSPQPISENALLTSSLESSNEGYALAKIAGLKLCQYYRKQYGRMYHSAMPTNLYGPGDNYHPTYSHVLPALIRKFEEARCTGAKEVTLWGTGTPLREFLYVDDLARALLFLLELDNPPDWVNIGSGEEYSIHQLAEIVRTATECNANIRFDSTMPDGTPRKLCDSSLIRSLGWTPQVSLSKGIYRALSDYRNSFVAGQLRTSNCNCKCSVPCKTCKENV